MFFDSCKSRLKYIYLEYLVYLEKLSKINKKEIKVLRNNFVQ